MLKPSLQLKLGQQLTMTPQLQQAIRLLQLPALELQAHIRELLETNVMLEPTEEAESTGTFEVQVTAAEHSQPAERAAESRVEVLEESWSEHGAGPAETPWSGDDEERQQEYADASGQSLQDHLLWQLELARLAPRELAVARAIVDAISDDGYLTESLAEIAQTLRPELECSAQEVQRVLMRVQALDPSGVGARSVAECIELQLRQLDPETPGLATALEIARAHLELLAGREFTLLRRELRVSEEELAAALALVRSCHPHPGAIVSAGAPEEPRDPPRDPHEGRPLDRRAADGVPRARRGAHAADDSQGHRRSGRDARVDDLARHLRQVHAHPARRVRAALLLLEPGRGRRRRRNLLYRHPREDQEARQGRGPGSPLERRAHRRAPLRRGHSGGAAHGRQVPRGDEHRGLERAPAGSETDLDRRSIMQLSITGHHVEVTPSLRSYVEKKLERIGRHFDQVIDVHCVLTVEKLRQKAEATLHVSGNDIHAEATEGDMYAAIDLLADKLDRCIKKYKEKRADHHAVEGRRALRM